MNIFYHLLQEIVKWQHQSYALWDFTRDFSYFIVKFFCFSRKPYIILNLYLFKLLWQLLVNVLWLIWAILGCINVILSLSSPAESGDKTTLGCSVSAILFVKIDKYYAFFSFFILAVVTCWLWSFFDSCWFIIKKDRKVTRRQRGSKYSLYNFFGITKIEKIEIKILKSQRHHKYKEIMKLLIFAKVPMS